MGTATILTMLSIGVVATIAEKVLNSFGKADMASLCNIAGLSGLGITVIGLIAQLIKILATL